MMPTRQNTYQLTGPSSLRPCQGKRPAGQQAPQPRHHKSQGHPVREKQCQVTSDAIIPTQSWTNQDSHKIHAKPTRLRACAARHGSEYVHWGRRSFAGPSIPPKLASRLAKTVDAPRAHEETKRDVAQNSDKHRLAPKAVHSLQRGREMARREITKPKISEGESSNKVGSFRRPTCPHRPADAHPVFAVTSRHQVVASRRGMCRVAGSQFPSFPIFNAR